VSFLPEFLVVGAAKSGTTSLFEYLNSHPEVFLPSIKEGRFFSGMPRDYKGGRSADFQNQGPRNIEAYLNLYSDALDKVKGDCSNDYFYFHRQSIKAIKKYYEQIGQTDPSILIVLRNPIERVFSMYHQIVGLGDETLDFEDCFNASGERIAEGYAWMFDLKGVGMSSEGVQAYLTAFEKVKVILTEDLSQEHTMEDLFSFLGVSPSHQVDLSRVQNSNSYAGKRSLWLYSKLEKLKSISVPAPLQVLRPFVRCMRYLNSSRKTVVLGNATRRSLEQFYIDDVSALSLIIGRDLTHWIDRN
jgi:hypothetical protein